MAKPPNNLPRYRVLTGADDEEFCRRVSDALDQGYVLHGGPSLAFDGDQAIVAQAVVWPEAPMAGHSLGFASASSASSSSTASSVGFR
jgi:hypothetical protein